MLTFIKGSLFACILSMLGLGAYAQTKVVVIPIGGDEPGGGYVGYITDASDLFDSSGPGLGAYGVTPVKQASWAAI